MQKSLMLVIAAVGATSMLQASIAPAQSNTPALPAAAAAPTDQGLRLEEIVVTAEKREERLQDVPITITALLGNSLRSERILDTKELQVAVPSLIYSSIGGFAQPFLRGIGSDLTSPNADPSVATYIDGAFLSSSQAAITNLLGVDRVEVLEGPQGTLYGRNAVGGAINIYTLTPGRDEEAEIQTTYGNFNRIETSGHVSGPVSDSLAIGLYGAYTQRESYERLIQTGPTYGQPNHETNYGFRAKAVWTPVDAVKLTGSIELTKVDSRDNAAFRNIQPNSFGIELGAPAVIQPFLTQSSTPVFYINKQTSGLLREEVDLGWARILGVTNYRSMDANVENDVDATILPIYSAATLPNLSRQYSQEVQLLSPTTSPIDWIAGVFYFHEHTGFDPDDAHSPILFPATINRLQVYGLVNIDSYAGFAQATVPLNWLAQGLKFTLGGRYTVDSKHFYDSRQVFLNDDTLLGQVDYPSASHTWKEFTPKVVLDYKIDDTLIYLSYSQGFKSGAYNIAAPSMTQTPVNPEKLDAVELGVKSDIADRRIRLNAAAFYYKFSDIQVEIYNFTNGGAGTELENAASAKAYGAEANLTALVTDGLTFNASIIGEHSEYTNFSNFSSFDRSTVPNTAVAVNVTGNQMQRTPKWSGSTGLEYARTLDGSHSLKGRLSWYYNDGYAFDPARLVVQKGYGLLNASVDLGFANNKYVASGWIANIADKRYYTGALVTPFDTLVTDGDPRTFGLTLTGHFH